MARARRRSARTNPQGSPEPAVEDTSAKELEPATATPSGSQGASEPQPQDEDRCPACKEETRLDWNDADKENWVRCDACKTWFHWRCVGEGDLEAIDKWFCKPCLQADPKRSITLKPPARKSARKRTQRDYAGLNAGNEQDPNRWLRMMQGKVIKPDPFKRMHGSEVTTEWLESDPEALQEPILVETPEGLGMEMPEGLTVRQIAESLGEHTPVEVIDVATQSNQPNWTLGKWANYYDKEPAQREKIYNVISLEISGTDLANKVLPPRMVREVDWVEKFWPSTKRGRGLSYPKVQLYCLMGVAEAWTDWHIDFAGSSVYYHILRGSKVFYFIRPTPANLAAYERWSGTEMQNSWLGDLCDEVFKIELHAGNTMIIPTGWIHAVYTPEDTLVFGGNFLHSYNVATQLKVRNIEISTRVPKKFRFPYFVKLCWYAGEKYLRDLKAKEEFPPRVLESVEVLADFLVAEARTMEKDADSAKREAKDQVPGDRVKDAPATARELRWRVRMASGYSSDDDVKSRRRTLNGHAHGSSASINGSHRKRKRTEEEPEVEIAHPTFLNFKPRTWDVINSRPTVSDTRTVKARRPDESAEWGEAWSQWKDVDGEVPGDGSGEASVQRKRDVVVKVRRTAKGLERQKVERILEDWTWGEGEAHTSVLPSTETGIAKHLPSGSQQDEKTAAPVPTEAAVAPDGTADVKMGDASGGKIAG